MEIQKRVVALIKHVLDGTTDQINMNDITEDELRAVISYATAQGVILFVSEYEAIQKQLKKQENYKQIFSAVYIQESQMQELELLLNTFEENAVSCVLLKGAVSRQFYPSPQLRSMGDIDLLYRPEQTRQVQELMRNLGYHYGGDTAKHDHYQKGKVTVEMHKTLCNPEWQEERYFAQVWERVQLREGYRYVANMTMEDHYLYTFTHLIEHFRTSGIGVRMVMDVYVLSQKSVLNFEYIDKVLEEMGYKEFHENILRLADVWFGKENQEDTPKQLRELEYYILNGHVFGNLENDRINTRVNHGNGVQFFLKAAFPSYKMMQTVYPWLKQPILLPVAWGMRGVQAMTNRRKNVKIQLKRAASFGENDERVEERRSFFAKYGLDSRQDM